MIIFLAIIGVIIFISSIVAIVCAECFRRKGKKRFYDYI